ncbi:MAG: hypothetical protein JWN86_758 [Planctomycetota bacterium]|nr:hypothetical protein [Planctomycetota bacterium]
MARLSRVFVVCLTALAVAGAGGFTLLLTPEVRASLFGPPAPANRGEEPRGDKKKDTVTVDVTEYTAPKDNDTLLVDDRLADKKTKFVPDLVDRRPLQGHVLNLSDSVLRLDVPIVKPDLSPELLVLHPSYTAAMSKSKGQVLPSVNMIDGKAKQFDDGLYAALDQAYYAGQSEAMKSHLGLIKTLHDRVAKGTPAANYLAAGLVIAGEPIEASAAARSMAESFLGNEVFSKPISFYTWNKTLSNCFRTLRFFSRPIQDRRIYEEIARVLGEDKALLADYRKATNFYGKLTNPLSGVTPAEAIGRPLPVTAKVALFPPSSSRETELFARLFPLGLPADANLMRELITAIRSGKVDLKPRNDGGWYDYQVYALETLLLPEKGEESSHLLLTKLYKKRMLEAFQALVTKRRETHARQLDFPAPRAMAREEPERPVYVYPRLRVEPNPTYYLRTARSYAFLANFLESTLGEATLKSLHGLRETGPRELTLHGELRYMRDLFYGFYLLSAEDIGLKPAFLAGETVDRVACETAAADWLARLKRDPDLAADTRVSVPVYYDQRTGAVRLWMTIGVRLAVLDTNYAKGPKIRKADGAADWKPVEPGYLIPAQYVIPVDEFAEVEIQGGRVLTRNELRAICDKLKTKARIVEAIQK